MWLCQVLGMEGEKEGSECGPAAERGPREAVGTGRRPQCIFF